MEESYWTKFNNVNFELPLSCIIDCSHQGECYEDVKYWQSVLNLNLDRNIMIKELLEYGSWETSELNTMDDSELEMKLIWLGSCDLKEELTKGGTEVGHCDDCGKPTVDNVVDQPGGEIHLCDSCNDMRADKD